MTSPELLSDELARLFNDYLASSSYHSAAAVRLRDALWDNKAGIIAALTRAPSTVGVEDELRAEIKTLKRQLAAETERADGLLLAAQAMSIGANHHD